MEWRKQHEAKPCHVLPRAPRTNRTWNLGRAHYKCPRDPAVSAGGTGEGQEARPGPGESRFFKRTLYFLRGRCVDGLPALVLPVPLWKESRVGTPFKAKRSDEHARASRGACRPAPRGQRRARDARQSCKGGGTKVSTPLLFSSFQSPSEVIALITESTVTGIAPRISSLCEGKTHGGNGTRMGRGTVEAAAASQDAREGRRRHSRAGAGEPQTHVRSLKLNKGLVTVNVNRLRKIHPQVQVQQEKIPREARRGLESGEQGGRPQPHRAHDHGEREASERPTEQALPAVHTGRTGHTPSEKTPLGTCGFNWVETKGRGKHNVQTRGKGARAVTLR